MTSGPEFPPLVAPQVAPTQSFMMFFKRTDPSTTPSDPRSANTPPADPVNLSSTLYAGSPQSGPSGQSLSQPDPISVPEPPSAAALGVGLAGLLLLRRRWHHGPARRPLR